MAKHKAKPRAKPAPARPAASRRAGRDELSLTPREERELQRVWRLFRTRPNPRERIERAFRRALFELPEFRRQGKRRSDVTARLRTLLRLFGSQGEDNVNAVRRIEYGPLRPKVGRPIYALKIKGKPVSLANLAYEVEGTVNAKTLRTVRRRYPQVDQADLAAAMRTIVLILSSLDLQIRAS